MTQDSTHARVSAYSAIAVGVREQRDYVLSREVYEHFLAAFDDRSPIHVDEDYARARGFEGRVMHGAILNGLLSHFVGMHFPGKLSVLASVDLRFAQPNYLGDALRVEAVVSQKLDARKVVVLDFTFTNLTRETVAARGRAQVLVNDES